MSRGADFSTATNRAYAMLSFMVQRQAAMLSFIDLFRIMGAIFLITIPFIALAKSPRLRGARPARNRAD